jgi:hypothetical protein
MENEKKENEANWAGPMRRGVRGASLPRRNGRRIGFGTISGDYGHSAYSSPYLGQPKLFTILFFIYSLTIRHKSVGDLI